MLFYLYIEALFLIVKEVLNCNFPNCYAYLLF